MILWCIELFYKEVKLLIKRVAGFHLMIEIALIAL